MSESLFVRPYSQAILGFLKYKSRSENKNPCVNRGLFRQHWPMPPAFTARKWWFNFSPQNGLSFDWSDGTKSSFTFWKDDEASFLGDCVFADTSGRWSSTACESYLQGAICQVPTGRFYSTQERCAVNLYYARHYAKQELWGKVERIICLQEGFGLLGDIQTNNRYRRQGYQMIQEP